MLPHSHETMERLEDYILAEIETNQDLIDLEDEDKLLFPLSLGITKRRIDSQSDSLRKYLHSYWNNRGSLKHF